MVVEIDQLGFKSKTDQKAFSIIELQAYLERLVTVWCVS